MRAAVVMRPFGWLWFEVLVIHRLQESSVLTPYQWWLRRHWFHFCKGLERDKVGVRLWCCLCLWECRKDRKWGERNRNDKTDTIRVFSESISSPVFAPIHHLDWVSHSSCLVLSLSNTSDPCQEKECHRQALGEKAMGAQRGRVDTWKGYPVETGLLGPRGEPCVSPWECTHFHVSPSLRQEAITSSMGLQMAVPATQGCRHQRITSLWAGWTALLRGRPGESHRAGQGSQGLCELLTGSYWNFPDYNQHFHSIIMRVKPDASCFNCHVIT